MKPHVSLLEPVVPETDAASCVHRLFAAHDRGPIWSAGSTALSPNILGDMQDQVCMTRRWRKMDSNHRSLVGTGRRSSTGKRCQCEVAHTSLQLAGLHLAPPGA